MKAPLLISLPHGLNASGVTTWAVRLVNALAAQGRACALVVHAEPEGQRALALAIDPRVDVLDARDLPRMDACDGNLEPFLPVYRLAVGTLAARAGGGAVVCMPSLLGDSYGIVAELTRQMGGLVRAVAVHHSDIRYNDVVCEHYAPMLSAFVGVSERIAERLRRAFASREHHVYGIPYGVEVPPHPARREPMAGRPVRLLYTGRMDHEQKRVAALVAMSDALARDSVAHELALVGDGPAAGEIDAMCADRPSVRRFPAAEPETVGAALDRADLFVLPSRYEGLSVSLLEALARGCVPVVTPSDSGTAQLVRDGETGFLADAGPDDGAGAAGLALSAAVERACAQTHGAIDAMRVRGHALVERTYSVALCAARYAAVIDRAAAGPARPWPAHLPSAFTGAGGGGSGTVPADAARRVEGLLGSLAGRAIAVYGVGRHTLELRDAFLRAPVRIAAFLDDDAARIGGSVWGVPIVSPEAARGAGVTDVVISSWLHQDDMWSRRAALERQGLRVHRLYGEAARPSRRAGACRPGVESRE